MKIVKFGALALALGLFAASCNNDTSTTTSTTDSTTMAAPAPVVEPVVAAPVADTAMHVVADTAKMKVEAKTTTTKTTEKK